MVALFTNHPKQGDVISFNQALCGLYAAGLGARRDGAIRHGRHGGGRNAFARSADYGRDGTQTES